MLFPFHAPTSCPPRPHLSEWLRTNSYTEFNQEFLKIRRVPCVHNLSLLV